MKKIIITFALLLSFGLANVATAQNINININLDKQPSWGPTGYDYAGYYYMPDIDVYYDITNSLFYYLSGGRWISAQYLPDKYRKYDLYNLYKVVINDSQPWLNNKTHKKSYSQYKGDRTQEVIRNSNNSKYNSSKDNNRKWVNTTPSNNNSQRDNNKQNNKQNSNNNSNSQRNNNRQNSNNNSSRGR